MHAQLSTFNFQLSTFFMEYAETSVLIGAKNTGKTTYVIACIKAYMQADEKRRVLIIDTTLSSPQYAEFDEIKPEDLLRWKRGVKRLTISFDNLDKILSILMQEEINNLMVVIEDAGKYMDRKVTKTQEIYFRDVKNKGRETFFIFHFFMDVPKGLFKMTNNFIIKKSTDTLKDVRERSQNPDIIAAFQYVNAHAFQYHSKVVKLN